MSTRVHVIGLSTLTLLGLACGAAHADRIAVPHERPGPIVTTPQASPYTVDLVDENGHELDVYNHRGRYYIQGQVGQRYSIRVTNPTSSRIEAVISVDGLDVIDGKTADFKGKRGYVVLPHGTLEVDGFRVSHQQVAAFRFSSVRNSYAGRKGQARNVGVIGVAIFAEQPQAEIILEQPHYRPRPGIGVRGGDVEEDGSADDTDYEPAPPAKSRAPAVGTTGSGSAGAPATDPAPPRDYRTTVRRERCCTETRKQDRPGLGTEFGERRHSAVSFTRFVRANATVPTAVAELRYNDGEGLAAIGIRLQRRPDANEIGLRETANPFPQSGFASPPAGWR